MNDFTSHALLDTSEAAQILGIKPGTLQNWRWRGMGPPFIQIGPQAVRYRFADLESFIAQRVRQAPLRRKRCSK